MNVLSPLELFSLVSEQTPQYENETKSIEYNIVETTINLENNQHFLSKIFHSRKAFSRKIIKNSGWMETAIRPKPDDWINKTKEPKIKKKHE